METTVTHETARTWHPGPWVGQAGSRETGKQWPAVAGTLGLSLMGFVAGRLSSASRSPLARILRAGGTVLSVASWAHLLLLRRWHLRWGATEAEIRRPMRGDALVPHPHVETTRALTVEAPPEAIWPWLVQMGYHRGGWYSYDWLDNFGVPSARRIIPELQELKVGDALTPFKTGFTVAVLEPQRSLVLVTRDKKGRITSSWGFFIEPISMGRSRLIERIRIRYSFDLGGLFWGLIFEPSDFVMMRKQMLTLKRRAEQARAADALDAAL
jgi:hypothetical protein